MDLEKGVEGVTQRAGGRNKLLATASALRSMSKSSGYRSMARRLRVGRQYRHGVALPIALRHL
jgi:hypothetical protein